MTDRFDERARELFDIVENHWYSNAKGKIFLSPCAKDHIRDALRAVDQQAEQRGRELEREECAKVCDAEAGSVSYVTAGYAEECARAIRARSAR